MGDPIGALRGLTHLIQERPAPLAGGDSSKSYTLDLGKDKSIGGSSFADTLGTLVNSVSAAQDNAGDLVARYLRGEQVELHQVMAASEEAGIALDLMVEVRNKVLDAYRTLISMQG